VKFHSAILAAAALACCSTNVSAAMQLRPCSVHHHYPDRVDALLDRPLQGEVLFRFTESSGFRPQHGIRLVRVGEHYRVYDVILLRQLWPSTHVPPSSGESGVGESALEEIPNDSAFAQISGELAEQVIDLVESEIAHAEDSFYFGYDGTTYRFRSADGACGTTWSPDEGTRTRRLVDLMETLASLARSSKNPAVRESLQRAMETTIGELSAPWPPEPAGVARISEG